SDNRLRELYGCTYTINQRHWNLITDLAGEPSNRSTTSNPPISPVAAIAIGIGVDFGASEGRVSREAPNTQPIATPERIAVMQRANKARVIGSSIARMRPI